MNKKLRISIICLYVFTSYSAVQSPYLQFTTDQVPAVYQAKPTAYAPSMITQGEKVYQDIQNGTTQQRKRTIDTYMQSIIALMFYLYSKAVDKNQAFSNGAFIIKDPGFKLFNFLYGFVEKKWKPKDMFKEINVDISGKGAYPRQSTHLHHYYIYTKKAEKGF